MANIEKFLSEEEDTILADIHERVCEELRELIEDYLSAVKEEVDGKGILRDIGIFYKDINLSLRLPMAREEAFAEAADRETKKKDVPSDMYI